MFKGTDEGQKKNLCCHCTGGLPLSQGISMTYSVLKH